MELEEKNFFKKFIILLLVVLICGVIIYFFTRAFVSKDLFKEEKEEKATEVDISYDTAIVGTILNRPEKEYYVMVFDLSDNDAYNYYSIAVNYTRNEESLPLYYVDLSSDLNKSHVSDKTVVENVDVKDMKFGEITLLKIKNGKISKALTDAEKIEKELTI